MHAMMPGDDNAISSSSGWATVRYALLGDSKVIAAIDAGEIINAGKCRDTDILPVPTGNSSSGQVGLQPEYPDSGGFGVLSLPPPEELVDAGGEVEYLLRFAPFPVAADVVAEGEWLDIVQLQFSSLHWATAGEPGAVYRMRYRRIAGGGSVLQVIEVRAPPYPSKAAVLEHVVAELPLSRTGATPVALRWRQYAFQVADAYDPCGGQWAGGCEGFPVEPPDPVETYAARATGVGAMDIESSLPAAGGFSTHAELQVLGPGDAVLFSTTLDAHWAELLLMGLIDYRVTKPSPAAATIGGLSLGVGLRLPLDPLPPIH